MSLALLAALLALPSFAAVRVTLRAPLAPAPAIMTLPLILPATLPAVGLTGGSLAPALAPLLLSPAAPPVMNVLAAPAAQSSERSFAGGAYSLDGSLPASFSVADKEDSAWVAAVIEAARASRTGRRVLKKIDELHQQRGHPVTIVVTRLEANMGEYDYDWEMVRMGAHFRKGTPAEAAPVLIHELLHVVQKEGGLPVDAIELELEAFGVTLKMIDELGLPFKPRSFERQVYKNFRRPLPEFVAWLTEQYSGSQSLRSGIKAYLKTLAEQEEAAQSAIARLEKRKAKQEAIIKAMRKSGQSKKVIKAYSLGQLAPIKAKLIEKRAILDWIHRDIDLLSTPEGAARYRAYSRRVMAMLRRYQKTYDR